VAEIEEEIHLASCSRLIGRANALASSYVMRSFLSLFDNPKFDKSVLPLVKEKAKLINSNPKHQSGNLQYQQSTER
jgi:ABC-type sulfate transport system substrate-binding protein